MTVPKKRKKLDGSTDPAVTVESQPSAESNPISEKIPKLKKTVTSANSSKSKTKVDKAFEVIDSLDKNSHDKVIELKKVDSMVPFQGGEGVHVRFKLDMIRWQDFVDGGKNRTEDDSIVIDFTIPYIWNLPIVGELTKAVIKELVKLRIL